MPAPAAPCRPATGVVAQVEAGGQAEFEAAAVFLDVIDEGFREVRQGGVVVEPAWMAMAFSVYITSVMWMFCGQRTVQ